MFALTFSTCLQLHCLSVYTLTANAFAYIVISVFAHQVYETYNSIHRRVFNYFHFTRIVVVVLEVNRKSTNWYMNSRT